MTEVAGTNHDRMFKTLLTTFFVEFVQAFLPHVAACLEPDSIEFLDKEIFTDLAGGDRHEVDLIVKARFRGQDTCFIIHIENQSSAQGDFPRRMFVYFARLLEKYNLPIYPVVLFFYDAPKRPEPNRYAVKFPGETVLQFKYKVIQLNRLSWRKFLKTPNPAAAALTTKMSIAPGDRLQVTREIRRMMATMQLDPARSQLIGGFMEAYLKLTAEEMKQYERKYSDSITLEESKMVEMWTSWGREGLAKGLQQGKETLVARLIGKRFGSVAPQVIERLDGLSVDQLDELGEALLDFNDASELDGWLKQYTPQQ